MTGAVLPASDQRILVVGAGATGLSAARFALARGARVRVADSRPEPPNAAAFAELGEPVETAFGTLDAALADDVDRVVISPGVPIDAELPAAAAARGVAVESDLAWFAATANAPILAVTGSNGKSTVVAWTRDVLNHAGLNAVACGNFGPPALDSLADEVEAYVLEASSFQLEAAPWLGARAACVLNISADHIDRHGTLARYAALKARIFAGAEIALVNADDVHIQAMAPRAIDPATEIVTFGSGPDVDYRLIERDRRATLAHTASSRTLPLDRIAVAGRHNCFNALAVWALAAAVGVDSARVAAAMPTFAGLPHRAQIVASHAGVTWVDDSKGTNLGAAAAALDSAPAPVVWLVGGQTKGADFASLGPVARRAAKVAVTFGEDGPTIATALVPFVAVAECDTLGQAVATAYEWARPGDTVLLSPGCASFDQFPDYAARGDAFVAAVDEVIA